MSFSLPISKPRRGVPVHGRHRALHSIQHLQPPAAVAVTEVDGEVVEDLPSCHVARGARQGSR